MQITSEYSPPSALKLLVQVSEKIRLRHRSIHTRQAYLNWIRLFTCHFGKRYSMI